MTTGTAEDTEDDVVERDVSSGERSKLADKGHAMADGSFPIANSGDLKNAIQAVGRAKSPGSAKAHIRRRAKALGHTDLIPDSWSESEDVSKPVEHSGTPVSLIERYPALSSTASTVRTDGTCRVLLITPGQGSSGYYSPEVLKRDGPGVFAAGTHMYLDHPTQSEEAERPERSVRDLIAVLSEDASWLEDGPDGPGLYGEAKVLGEFKDLLENLAPHVGLSIRALGEASEGELPDGTRGRVVERLMKAESVDIVTRAGRGGRVLGLLESMHSRTVSGEDGAVRVAESSTCGQWFEACIHRGFTVEADSRYGEGYLNRPERIALSAAIGDALNAFTTTLAREAPSLYKRSPYDQPKNNPTARVTDSSTTQEDTEVADTPDLQEATRGLQAEVDTLKECVRALTAERDLAHTARDSAKAELQESSRLLDEAQTTLVREAEAKRLREARDVVRELLEAVEIPAGLPVRSIRQRLERSLVAEAPRADDGSLDRVKLAESVKAAAASEVEYLSEAAGLGAVTGVGGSSVRPIAEEDFDKSLANAYVAFGLAAPATG